MAAGRYSTYHPPGTVQNVDMLSGDELAFQLMVTQVAATLFVGAVVNLGIMLTRLAHYALRPSMRALRLVLMILAVVSAGAALLSMVTLSTSLQDMSGTLRHETHHDEIFYVYLLVVSTLLLALSAMGGFIDGLIASYHQSTAAAASASAEAVSSGASRASAAVIEAATGSRTWSATWA